jgi:predicted ATPase
MTIGQPVRCRAFVGRRKELAALDEARKALARSSARCVLISGEAGIGKSRLLNEFLAQTGSRRARHTINTECLQGAQEPLGPIRALIRALLPAVAAADLPKPVARALAQVAPADQPHSAASDGHVTLEKEQLFSALLSFLQMVCVKRATILTIEDIHWADESTLQFLAYVAQRAQAMRLLVLTTYRSD